MEMLIGVKKRFMLPRFTLYHGRVSSVVDSFVIPVGFLKDKMLPSPRKCSYKVNLNFHR